MRRADLPAGLLLHQAGEQSCQPDVLADRRLQRGNVAHVAMLEERRGMSGGGDAGHQRFGGGIDFFGR